MRVLRPIWTLRDHQSLGPESRCDQEGHPNATPRPPAPRAGVIVGQELFPGIETPAKHCALGWSRPDALSRLSESLGEPGSWAQKPQSQEKCPHTPRGCSSDIATVPCTNAPGPSSHCNARNSALLSLKGGMPPAQLSQRRVFPVCLILHIAHFWISLTWVHLIGRT